MRRRTKFKKRRYLQARNDQVWSVDAAGRADLWLFTRLVVFIIASIVILIGFVIFGPTLVLFGSLLAYNSPEFPNWLRHQSGYQRRLAIFTGIERTSGRSLAISILLWGVLLWGISFFIAFIIFSSLPLSVSTWWPILTLAVLLGFPLGYGWFVLGWFGGNPVETPDESRSLRIRDAQDNQLRHLSLDDMLAMDPISFECFVGRIFTSRGYNVTSTPARGDNGVDLIIHRDGQKGVVQCKRYQGRVGPGIVRDLAGAMRLEATTVAYLVTTGSFTANANRDANKLGINLIDGQKLVEWTSALSRVPDLLEQKATPVTETISPPSLRSVLQPLTIRRLVWSILLAAVVMPGTAVFLLVTAVSGLRFR